ncbi:ATP-binding cassette domain-containing protein [uncultured Propionibacterium sp.]|uniref:ATP-binding cassette domain-containing protein n=1 Tax=uncultured Propionibacterium sp. TaxID=218066 RepID=UPI0037DD5F1C
MERLPEGWQSRLGENGAKLSGGERQRISIARALLKDEPIVLLDEATSSLDPENETLIQEALSALVAVRTVLVIAHRLRTVTGADRIVVLDDGAVVEMGTHMQSMDRGGRYARLYELQRASAAWDHGISEPGRQRGRSHTPVIAPPAREPVGGQTSSLTMIVCSRPGPTPMPEMRQPMWSSRWCT